MSNVRHDSVGAEVVNQRRAVGLSDAVAYVNKVKNRFSSQPHIYEQFLGALYSYQRGAVLPHRLYHLVAPLLRNMPDLLEEFQLYVPEDTAHRQDRRVRAILGIRDDEIVLNDYYTKDQYVQRRAGFLAEQSRFQLRDQARSQAEVTYPIHTVPDAPHGGEITFDQHLLTILHRFRRREPDWTWVARNDAEVVFSNTNGPLSVQEVSRSELLDMESGGAIGTLLPLPTTANTQTLLDSGVYPSTEWAPNNQSTHPDLNSHLVGSRATLTSQAGRLPVVYGGSAVAPSFSQATADLQHPPPQVAAPSWSPLPPLDPHFPSAPPADPVFLRTVLANLNSCPPRAYGMTDQASQNNTGANGQAPSVNPNILQRRQEYLFGGNPTPPRLRGLRQEPSAVRDTHALAVNSDGGTAAPTHAVQERWDGITGYGPIMSAANNNNAQAIYSPAYIEAYDGGYNSDGHYHEDMTHQAAFNPTGNIWPTSAPAPAPSPFAAPAAAQAPALDALATQLPTTATAHSSINVNSVLLAQNGIIAAIANGIIRPNTSKEAREAAEFRLTRLVARNPTGRTQHLGFEFPPLPEYWPHPEESTYCVCGGDDEDQYIQCDACKAWNHQPCVRESFRPGFGPGEADDYTCPACTPFEHVDLLMRIRRQNPV